MADTENKLKGWMGAHGISGKKVSEDIGMPYETFKLKINGKTAWKLPEIKRLMEYTGCRFDELF